MPERDPVEEREEAIAALIALFLLAQNRIVALVAKYPSASMTRRRLAASSAELNAVMAALREDVALWIGTNVAPSYRDAAAFAQERARAMGLTRTPGDWSGIREQTVDAIGDNLANDLARAAEAMRTDAERYFRRGLQNALADAAARRAELARGRAALADRVLEEMRDRIIDGEYVQAGSRRMKIDDYVEMVTRTRMQESITDATLHTALSYGLDLVMVGIRVACPKICMPFIGKVYSISGTSGEFPRLNERPPFHPNCLCYLIPVSSESLKEKLGRGYVRLVEYSNRADVPMPQRDFYERAVGKQHLDAADRELETIARRRQERRET